MTHLRDLANRCREIPLLAVLEKLGCEQDRIDRQKWHTQAGLIWLGKAESGQKFFDHKAGKGGGGAIDLVMYAQACGFKQAVELLVGMLGHAQQATPSVRLANLTDQFILPRNATKHLGRVVEYLTKTRKLPRDLVSLCIGRGQVYSDERRNAVFLCVDLAGNVTGAELRGSGEAIFKGMAVGSQRGEGFFMLEHTSPTHLVIVESAIDALSYRALFPGELAAIISTAGIMPACPAAVALAKMLGVTDITVAYDDDQAGNEAADKLISQMAVDRMLTLRRRTPGAKDWNEALEKRDGHLFEEAA